MGTVLQTVIVGLSAGAVYALVGLGFTLIWALTRTLALAHGDTLVASVMVAVLVVDGRSPVASVPGIGASIALVCLTLAAALAVSLLVYGVAVRPFLGAMAVSDRAAASSGWVAGTLLAGLAIRAVLGLIFPGEAYAVPDPLHLDGLTSSGVVRLPDSAGVPVRAFGVFVVAAVIAVVADWVVSRTRLGRGMRAVADDRDAAALLGVSPRRAAMVAFGLAGLFAGVAGLLALPDRAVTTSSGIDLGLAGAAAALVGGLGSPRGAVAGGLIVGLAQQVAVALPGLGAQWSDVVPLALLVALVAVRPEGFGMQSRQALK